MVSCGIDRQNMMLSERYTWNTYDIYWSTIHTRAVGHVECLVFRVVASGAAQASFKSETWLWDMCGTCVGRSTCAFLGIYLLFSVGGCAAPGLAGLAGLAAGLDLKQQSMCHIFTFQNRPYAHGPGYDGSRKLSQGINRN